MTGRPFVLVLVLVLGGLAPARAQDGAQKEEKARSLVSLLRKADDEVARRDLYQLGAPSLAPLSEALETEAEPAAWARLAETFESVLRARLQDLETRLAREEREMRERMAAAAPTGTATPQPPTPEEVSAALRGLEADVLSGGYAAARELARPGGARDDLGVLAREELLNDLRERLAEDAEGLAETDALATRLATLGPLAAPLLEAAIAKGSGATRAVAEKAREQACARYADRLRAEAAEARRFAEEGLFGLGELSRPTLEKLRAEGSADVRWRAARLLQRVTWAVSEDLYVRIAHLLEGFEKKPWNERRLAAIEIEKQGGQDAVPALRRILERDPSVGVKVAAAESLARQGDRAGVRYLSTLGMTPLTQSPEVLAAIAMDQGIRYLQIRRYEKAIDEFGRVLAIQPENEVAHYNLACAYALRFGRDKRPADREKAFERLEFSTTHGFEDWEHIQKDEDLASLRDDPRFAKIIERLKLKRQAEERR